MLQNETITTQLSLCRRINDDIWDLVEEVIEGKPTPDELSNVLLGIKQLSEIRFAKLERMIRAKYPDEN